MVTDGLRECSVGPGPPLTAELLTIAGAAMLDVCLLVTGSRFPCCAGMLPPPTTSGALAPFAAGPDTDDLVAWA